MNKRLRDRRLSLLPFALLFSSTLFAQVTTTVTGSLSNPDGSLPSGFLSIVPTVAFTSADGHNVMPGPPIHVTISAGQFSVGLIPNAGSATASCTPPNVCDYYQVSFNLTSTTGSSYSTQIWEVPATGPVAYQTIVQVSPPSVNFQFPLSQVTPPAGCVGFTNWSGTGWTCSTPSGAGTWSNEEVPGGQINSSNETYSLAYSPIAGSLRLVLNGLTLHSGAGNDFTLSGSTITFLYPPTTGSNLICWYLH
jgi:hypothetical protein